jgi:hypothetical protein
MISDTAQSVTQGVLTTQSPAEEVLAPKAEAGLARGVWAVAAAVLAVELLVSGRYGFHRDELYFIVAGRHPALGYVDMPPLAPLLTRVATWAFGLSPEAVRVLPALAGAATAAGGGFTAWLLGGRAQAQVLAALATGAAPVLLAADHLAGTTPYDLLAWTVAVASVLAATRSGRSQAWLVAGLALGLGLENKDLPLLLVLSAAVGILAFGPRRALRDRYLWAGAALAIALWAPNLAWQVANRWPELQMAHSLHIEHSAGSDYANVLPAQLLYLGVASLPLAVVGVRALWRERSTRFLVAAAFLVLAYVVAYIPGRPYYDDGFLPLVFAAGAVSVEARHRLRVPRRWFAAPLIFAAATLPLALPVLPEAAWSGNAAVHKVNYDMTETVGWPELTSAVAKALDGLTPVERAGASIFTANYGEASALIVLGGPYHLPPVLSGHNTFWLWGPGRAPDRTVVAVASSSSLEPYFASCRDVATFTAPHDIVNDEKGTRISLCTRPSGTWASFWGRLRHYD